jgi:methionine biosynthesis protein MetW
VAVHPAYDNPRPDVQALVPATVRRVLDVGCATGRLGGAIRDRTGAEVIGVELDPDLARQAEGRLDAVVREDAAHLAGRGDLGRFDCVICADVLEHLVEPEAALRGAVAHLDPGGTVIVSLPNVRYWETFWQLAVRGRWPRRSIGLFDRTHVRWFTLADAVDLLDAAGLEVRSVTRRMLRPDGARWPRPVERAAARVPGVRTLLTLQNILVAGRR